MSIDITTARRSTATVVAVAGEIDVFTATDLDTVLQRVIDDDSGDVVVDLTDTTFLDSTALGALVGVDNRLRPMSREFKLVCPNPQLLKTFRITRLDTIWTIYPSVVEAVDNQS